MSTSKDFIAYILDQIGDDTHARVQAMFGEYALYFNNVVVALVCDATVFLKINEKTIALLGTTHQKGFPYPGAKEWYVLDAEIIENPTLFKDLLVSCAEYIRVHQKSAQG